jgi:hypothetical protein
MSEDLGRLKGRPKRDGAVNHLFFFGDNFCASGHATDAMPGVGVITLDGDSPFFADNVTIFRQNCRKYFPMICKKCAIF